MLKYVRSFGCHWDEYTCWMAAINGHADVLRWAIFNGCPEPLDSDRYIQKMNNLFENGCPKPMEGDIDYNGNSVYDDDDDSE